MVLEVARRILCTSAEASYLGIHTARTLALLLGNLSPTFDDAEIEHAGGP